MNATSSADDAPQVDSLPLQRFNSPEQWPDYHPERGQALTRIPPGDCVNNVKFPGVVDVFMPPFVPMQLSVGSKDHYQGTCNPCVDFWKPSFCSKGLSCEFCHLCPDGEIKRRKQQKIKARRAAEKEGNALFETAKSQQQTFDTRMGSSAQQNSQQVPGYLPLPSPSVQAPGYALYDFDGSGYGSQFLSVQQGDLVIMCKDVPVEAGWAYGKTVHADGWFPVALWKFCNPPTTFSYPSREDLQPQSVQPAHQPMPMGAKGKQTSTVIAARDQNRAAADQWRRPHAVINSKAGNVPGQEQPSGETAPTTGSTCPTELSRSLDVSPASKQPNQPTTRANIIDQEEYSDETGTPRDSICPSIVSEQPNGPSTDAEDSEQRRVDPMLEGRAVTFRQMCSGLCADEELSPEELRKHWKDLKPASEAVLSAQSAHLSRGKRDTSNNSSSKKVARVNLASPVRKIALVLLAVTAYVLLQDKIIKRSATVQPWLQPVLCLLCGLSGFLHVCFWRANWALDSKIVAGCTWKITFSPLSSIWTDFGKVAFFKRQEDGGELQDDGSHSFESEKALSEVQAELEDKSTLEDDKLQGFESMALESGAESKLQAKGSAAGRQEGDTEDKMCPRCNTSFAAAYAECPRCKAMRDPSISPMAPSVYSIPVPKQPSHRGQSSESEKAKSKMQAALEEKSTPEDNKHQGFETTASGCGAESKLQAKVSAAGRQEGECELGDDGCQSFESEKAKSKMQAALEDKSTPEDDKLQGFESTALESGAESKLHSEGSAAWRQEDDGELGDDGGQSCELEKALSKCPWERQLERIQQKPKLQAALEDKSTPEDDKRQGFETTACESGAESNLQAIFGVAALGRLQAEEAKRQLEGYHGQRLAVSFGQAAAEKNWSTVMIKGLPIEVQRDCLVRLLKLRGCGNYNFLYVPCDLTNKKGRGFAFVNFVSNAHAKRAFLLEGFNEWSRVEERYSFSSKHCTVPLFNIYPITCSFIPHQKQLTRDCFKPACYEDDERIPFPPPSKRLKPPRLKQCRVLRDENGRKIS